MKKLFAMLFVAIAAFSFSPQAIFAADGDTDTEPVIEVVLTPEEEQEIFLEELNLTLSMIFSYVGGFAGLSALMAFGLRFIRERNVIKHLRDEVSKLLTDGQEGTAAVNNLIETIGAYTLKADAMEKSFIGMVQLSSLNPVLKEQIITGLQNDTLSVQDVIETGLLTVQNDIASNVLTQESIEQSTASLLEQLSKDNDEA